MTNNLIWNHIPKTTTVEGFIIFFRPLVSRKYRSAHVSATSASPGSFLTQQTCDKCRTSLAASHAAHVVCRQVAAASDVVSRITTSFTLAAAASPRAPSDAQQDRARQLHSSRARGSCQAFHYENKAHATAINTHLIFKQSSQL